MGAESEAKTRIDNAKKQASVVRSKADEAATAVVVAAREQAVTGARARLDRARFEAETLLEASRDQDAADNEAIAALAAGATDALVVDIVAMITGRPS